MIRLLIEIIGFQLVFLLVYDLFLKKETFFQWNRLYLMGTFFSSLFLPLIKIKAFREVIPVGRSWKTTYIQQLNEISLSSKPTALAISWPEILYWSGLVVFLLLLVRKLYVIYLLRKSGQKSSFPEYTRIDISNSSIAFSFFRDIFIGDRLPLLR